MTEQNLFNQPDDDNLQIDPNKNYLEELVGEDKKFKTPEDLAKGKFMSDSYINTLERRLDAIREDYTRILEESKARPKLEELIDRLAQQSQQPSSRTEPDTNEDNNNRPAIPTLEQIESLVSNSVAKLDSTRREQENYNSVLGKVRERYGNGYKEVLKTQAEQLGLSDEEVNQMARRNPNLFFKTFDINTQQSTDNFQSPPISQMRRDNFLPRTEKRTLSYYKKMMKEKPMLYLDPKIAIQMDRDSQELGSAFFDTE